MDDGERGQQRGEQAGFAVEYQRGDAVNREYRGDVGDAGHGASQHANVVGVIEERLGRYLHELEDIEREAAVVEPARVPRTPLCVEKQGKLAKTGRRMPITLSSIARSSGCGVKPKPSSHASP